MKKFLKILPILAIAFIFLIASIVGKIKSNKFYKKQSNSIVVSREKGFGAIYVYVLNDELEIRSLNKDYVDIEVGDSVVKKANSWEFSIFRKDVAGRYFFNKQYNYEETLKNK